MHLRLLSQCPGQRLLPIHEPSHCRGFRPIMRYDYILVRCRSSLNTNRKAAKRKTVIDQTRLLNEVKHFAARHLTQLQIAEVSRAISNTGKYAVPIYYVRVHGDDHNTIVRRSYEVREKIKAFSKHGVILRVETGETNSQGWEGINFNQKEMREIDEMRARYKKVELPKLEWEMDKIIASLELKYRTPTVSEPACSSEDLSSSDESLPPDTESKSKKRPRKSSEKPRVETKKARLA